MVVDHFHTIRLANAVVDQARRRTQQATLGHRGRKRDPLYRIRKLLLTAAEQLTNGDERGYRLGWWLEIPPVRWPRPGRARSCSGPSMPPTVPSMPGGRWSASTAGQMASRSVSCAGWLAPSGHGRPRCLPGMPPMAAPTGPTEAVNLLTGKVKRVGHGFWNFANYRLPLLLHCGVRWQIHQTARLRRRSAPLAASSSEGTGSRDRVPSLPW